jgi:hypothetical protein
MQSAMDHQTKLLFRPFHLALLISLQVMRASAGELVISELVPTNHHSLADDSGDDPDWFELANTGGDPINLGEYFVSDDPDRPMRWRFPNLEIPAGGFLTVFASGKNRSNLVSSPESPRTIPGLKIWLSSIDGLRAIPNVPSKIGTWYDTVQTSLKATQSQRDQAPDLAQDPRTGAPLLAFDGVNDQLTLNLPETRGPFTIFCVAAPQAAHEIDSQASGGVSGTTGQRYLLGAEHGGDYTAGLGISVGTNGISVYEHGSGYMPALAVLETRLEDDLQVFSVTLDQQRPAIGLNGHPAKEGFVSGRSITTAPTRIGLGPYGAFQGLLAEFLLYDRALSETERQGVEAYLARRWSLMLAPVIHTDFSIENGGEPLLLSNLQGETVDLVPAIRTPPDVSLVRDPDQPDSWVFCENPTPNRANIGPYKSAWLEPPTFSHSAGYYEQSFRLSIASNDPDAEIRFSIDGSEPGRESRLYREILSMRSRIGAPDVISMIPTGGGWQPPSAPGYKAVVIRARAFKDDAIASDISTRTFMIGPALPFTMPVISLVTDPDFFFSPGTGIYVSGEDSQGNYWNRGRAWERPVHIEFFETDGTVAFAQDAAVRIHGGTSRQFPQKNLRIYGRNAYGDAPFEYQIFPDRPVLQFKRFLLRATGHDHFYAFCRDPLMQAIAGNLDIDLQGCRPAIVLINGEYWGIHNIRESLDGHYLESHYGVDSSEVDILEGFGAANEGSPTHYQELIQYVSTHDLSIDTHYRFVQGLMEIGNYTDYRLAEIFFYRWDMGNIKFWRPQSTGGRWRWFLFDTDVGYGGFASIANPWTFNMMAYETEANGPWTHLNLNDHNNPTATFLLRNLLKNEQFKDQFIRRYADLLNTEFRTDRAIRFIDGFEERLQPEMPAHIQRWRAPGSMAEWHTHIEYLREYARKRPQYAREHLREYFQLGNEVGIKLHFTQQTQGWVQVNSVEIKPADYDDWNGIYFKGMPITITAVPKPGYVFDSWLGLHGNTSSELRLWLNGEVEMEPVFKPIPAQPGPRITRLEAEGTQQIHIQASGDPGRPYTLQWSGDLVQWIPVGWLQADPEGRIDAALPVLPSRPSGFYRLVE